MLKVAAFHSKKPAIKPVYHVHKACPEGRKIEAQHLASAAAMRLRCEHSIKLQAQGKSAHGSEPAERGSKPNPVPRLLA